MIKKIGCLVWRFYLMFRLDMKMYAASMLQKVFSSDYKEKRVSVREIYSIHRKGFTVDDWLFLDLENKDYKKYLSNVQYYKMHPINGRYSAWIDDKLTLKYLCTGTVLDSYMPEYYFQIDANGKLLKLMNCKIEKNVVTVEDVADFLVEKKELAVKLIDGAIGAGFYKAEFANSEYYLNDEKMNRNDFCKKIETLKNYLIIEYLHPHQEIAKYCPNTVNSIRYLVGRIDEKLEMLKSFIRFGTIESGFVENYNAGGVLCYLDENGYFSEGNIIDRTNSKNSIIKKHPDSGEYLESKIPLWDEIVNASRLFDNVFPQLNYMGIDFVVTSNNEVKVLEVNSLTSLDALEMDGSILESRMGKFFKIRL